MSRLTMNEGNRQIGNIATDRGTHYQVIAFFKILNFHHQNINCVDNYMVLTRSSHNLDARMIA